MLPELIDLDEWGYPIVQGPVTAELHEQAQEAVRVCPQLALRLRPPHLLSGASWPVEWRLVAC